MQIKRSQLFNMLHLITFYQDRGRTSISLVREGIHYQTMELLDYVDTHYDFNRVINAEKQKGLVIQTHLPSIDACHLPCDGIGYKSGFETKLGFKKWFSSD